MTAAATKLDLKQQASAKPPEPPSIKATYAGQFYKKVGKGYEYVPFKKTVKWPYSAVQNEGYSPIALFHRYKKAKLMAELGGVDLRTCQLIEIEGEMPQIRSQLHKLDWTPGYADLVEIAQNIGEIEYVHIDLKTNERENRRVELNPHLYPDAFSLRGAIKLLVKEPEAFDREQQKLAKADAKVPKAMEAEIAALADD